jgi:hypothetical protein
MVMVVSETKEVTPKEETKKKKTKKKEETQPTPTPTPTPTPLSLPQTPPPPKETKKKAEKKAEEKAKETKPTTKETKPTTKPTPTKRPKIRTVDWEKFEKFEPKTKPTKKSWVKEAIERATKEPVEIKELTKGQILALVNQVERYNKKYMDRIIDIKYDIKRGIAILAPAKKYFSAHSSTQ